MVDLLLAVLVLSAMAVIAAVDARRMIVDPRLVLLLVAAGLLWRLFGSADTGPLWSAGVGAGLGIAVVAVPIALAQWRRRRWPLFPGDAMLLGGVGFVLGPLGLGWSMLLGSACALLHRVWLQRRRGRSVLRGYCPLGPGMVAGAMAVFLFIDLGGSLAADGRSVPLPQPRPAYHDTPLPALPRPRAFPSEEAMPMLAATELAPVRVPLPPGLAGKEIAIEEAGPLPFAAVAGRIALLAGVPVEVEERPARVAGGAMSLADPPAVALAFEGRLPELLNLVAARTGYDWTWIGGAIVLYRHWDVAQRAPEAAPGAPIDPAVETGAVDGGFAGSDEGSSPDRGVALNQGDSLDQGDALWVVERARHGTLRAVLEDWGGRAGWTVVWNSARRFAVGADAYFGGGFLDAVDELLAAPATRRSLVALAHEPNRHLVIVDAGALR